MKALLIGCGNIGAMYDYDSEDLLSHAKAYHHFGFDVDFIEPNQELSSKVKLKYFYTEIKHENINWGDYQFVSICTPTSYHYHYLKEALEANVPIIICEKPISDSIDELNQLNEIYLNSKSKVLINYIRRFQEKYILLKEEISNFKEPLQYIQCNYYKGVMNYSSHALDTICFLTGFDISKTSIIKKNSVADFFDSDPTITFEGEKKGVRFYFNGRIIDYPLFEIDLFFTHYRVLITDGGNRINVFYKGKSITKTEDAVNNYMLGVFEAASSLYHNSEEKDNFQEALLLNKTLLKLINQSL